MDFKAEDLEQLNLPQAGQRTRVLIVTKNKSYGAVFIFLQKRNYELMVVNSTFLAVREAQKFRPHVVMLSWSSQNIIKMYQLFSKTLKAICIVFSETTGRKTTAALTSSGIPNTMIAPITGPAVHMKIQSLIRKKTSKLNQKKNKKILEKKISMGVPVDDISKVPPETVWEQVLEQKGDLENQVVWKGTYESSAGENKTFHFVGENAPFYNSQQGGWEGLDTRYLTEASIDPSDFYENQNDEKQANDVVLQEPFDSDEMSKFENALANELEAAEENDVEEESDPLFNAEDPYVHDEKNKATQVTKLQTNSNKKRLSILAHHTRGVIENIVQPDASEPQPIGVIDSVAVAVVESLHFKGYLVCNSSQGFAAIDMMEKVYEKLKVKMRESKEAMVDVAKTIILECKPVDFISWAKESAEFIVTSQQANVQMAVAYVPVEAIPEILQTTNEEIVKINLETDILGDTKLLFDVYIHMEKNHKYIKYLRKSSEITQKTIDKLIHFGVTHVYVKKSDIPMLHAYWATIRIFQAA